MRLDEMSNVVELLSSTKARFKNVLAELCVFYSFIPRKQTLCSRFAHLTASSGTRNKLGCHALSNNYSTVFVSLTTLTAFMSLWSLRDVFGAGEGSGPCAARRFPAWKPQARARDQATT